MSLGKCMQSSDHRFSEDTECFLYPYRSLCPFAISPIPMPLALFSFLSLVLLFLECHVYGMLHVVPSVWLLSLCIMLLRFLHSVACVSDPSLLIPEDLSVLWVGHPLSMCLLNDVRPVSSGLRLWIKWLEWFPFGSLWERMFSLPLRRCWGGEWLGPTASEWLPLWEPLCSSTSNVWGPHQLSIFISTCYPRSL